MRFNKKIIQPVFWLFLPIATCIFPAYSQAGCSSYDGLRTCNLGGSHNLDYAANPKEISFTVRSRWLSLRHPFYVKLSPLSGSTFSLFSDNGEQLDISMAFGHNGRAAQALSPGTRAGAFKGSMRDENTFLAIEVDRSQVPSSSRYSASFQMKLIQYWPIRTETVDFDIVLDIEPSIAIRNLGDINLSNSGISFGQVIKGREDLCVGGIGFGNYTVNLSSSNGSTGGGGSDAYELGGTSENIPYSVTFSDDLSGNSGVAPSSLGDIPGAFTRKAAESCIVDNARIYVTVAPTEWENANEAYYTDTLTITVSSQ